MRELPIDTLFVIPAYLNPFKNETFAPAHLRLAWVKKALASYPKVVVLDDEAMAGRSVPTIESVEALQLRYNPPSKPYLIIGADNVARLPQWHRYEALAKRVEFVVGTREGIAIDEAFRTLGIDVPISSTQVRHHFTPQALPLSIRDEVSDYFNSRKTMQKRLEAIRSVLDDKKAEDIEIIDLEGQEYIAKAVVIATSLNARHGESLLNELRTQLKPKGEQFLATEETGEWIVADLGDILVHIMTKATREKYTMEQFLADVKAGRHLGR